MITNTLINKRYDIKHGAGSKGIKNHENVKLKTATMREYIFLDIWFCRANIIFLTKIFSKSQPEVRPEKTMKE